MNWEKEERLLRLCAQTQLNEDEQLTLNQLAESGLNWEYLLQKSTSHGLAALLYYHLKHQSALPAQIKQELKKIYYAHAAGNTILLSELEKVLTFFRQAKIPLIVLKGAALLKAVYANIALRPMADVDLLIHPEHLACAKQALVNLGYTLKKPEHCSSLESFGTELAFVQEGGILLEIHWDLVQYERFKHIVQLDSDALWKTAKVANIANVETLVLSPEYLIFNLCLHLGLVHSFSHLIWLCDLKELLRYYQEELDWQYISEKAKAFRIKTVLYLCLYFAQQLLGAAFPSEVLKQLEPPRIRKRLLKFLSRKSPRLSLVRFLQQLLLMDNAQDALRVLRKILFPSRDWLRYRYALTSPWKTYLYRLIHPVLLPFRFPA